MDERARGDSPSGFPTGEAVLTPGFHLPSRSVIHTVGPIVSGEITDEHREALACPYRRCLEEAAAHGPRLWPSAAFPPVSSASTGGGGAYRGGNRRRFPLSLRPQASELRAIFDVFGDRDEALYRALLGL